MTLNYSKILKNSNGDTDLLQSKNNLKYFALQKSKDSPYTIKPLVDNSETNWKALSAEKLNDSTGSVVWRSNAKEIKEVQYTINDAKKTWKPTNTAGTRLEDNSPELLKEIGRAHV